VNPAAQLKRIAAAVPAPRVRIYLLESAKGVQTYVWLCDDCLLKRTHWTIREGKDPPHVLPCNDCEAP
jgi:hypothetical protein